MTRPPYTVRLHFIDDADDKLLLREYNYVVPRVGDEVRLEGPKYFKVIQVVHVYDEPDAMCHRANIGLEEVK